MYVGQPIWIVLICGFIWFASRIAGWAGAYVCAYIVSAAGPATTIFALAGLSDHIGIAASAPTIFFSDILMLSAIFSIWSNGDRLEYGWLLLSFVLVSLIFLFTTWGNTLEQWSGIKLYSTSIIAFSIGRWMQKSINKDISFVLSIACLLSCGAQLLEILAQSRGSTLFGVDNYSLTFIKSGRMVGLFNHPGLAGKYVFLLLCFALPLTTRSEISTRRITYAAIICGLIATIYTQSRANSLAVAVTLVLWIVFSGREISFLTKTGAFCLGGIILVMNSGQVSALQARQEVDPFGGYREWFLKTAFDQIKNAPLSGTGPNYYIEKVGEYDAFAFAGFPVHNAFVFAIVELGLFLALLFFFPVLAVISSAIGKITYQKNINLQAATVYALLPGFLVISLTGWGLMTSAFLPLWFMGFGFISSGKLSDEEPAIRETGIYGPNFQFKNRVNYLGTDHSDPRDDTQ
jgi:hypothetical protein